MSPGRKRAPGIEGLVGCDVEARTNGSVVRGRLESVDGGYLVIARATTGRRTFVALAHLAVLVDERAPYLSQRDILKDEELSE